MPIYIDGGFVLVTTSNRLMQNLGFLDGDCVTDFGLESALNRLGDRLDGGD